MTEHDQDVVEENPNVHYREALTVWGETMSAQVRGLATMALHHYHDAPRSTEDGQPHVLTTLDMVLLRDLLNAATARGQLPKPEGGAAEDAYTIGHRPTFVEHVSRAYQAGLAHGQKTYGNPLRNPGEPVAEPDPAASLGQGEWNREGQT